MNNLSEFPYKTHLKLLTFISRSLATKTSVQSLVPHGPVEELSKRIESGTLEADSHQTLVTEALQGIHNQIQGYLPAPESSGFFSLFTSSSAKKSNAPKGLYVHGSVGGGKTTLMDLFYDCCSNVGG